MQVLQGVGLDSPTDTPAVLGIGALPDVVVVAVPEVVALPPLSTSRLPCQTSQHEGVITRFWTSDTWAVT